jgi:iron complex outermembrane recepter protein
VGVLGKNHSVVLTLLSSLAVSSGVMAAETAVGLGADDAVGASLAEVVVTAERRETRAQDTPVSVSALSAADLQERSTWTLQSLMGDVPGLSTPGSITNMQSIFIRGIGTADPGFYPAVAVYVDDVYLPRPFGVGTFILPDIERIEILRGPQGTLYGQNSSAGAVKFVSRDPGNTTVGSFSVNAGNLGYRDFDGYFASPIAGDVLSVGVALASRRTEGYTFNEVLDRHVDATRLDEGRLKFKLTPADGTSAVLAIDGTRDRSDNASYIPLGYPGANPRTTFASVDPELHRTDWGATLHVDQKITNQLSFKSITAYRRLVDDPSPWDEDGTPAVVDQWTQYIHQHQFSQEFQLSGSYSRLDFTAGAVYFQEHLLFDRITGSSGKYSEVLSDLRDHSEAVYGQLDYHLTDALNLTLGARYGTEAQTFDNSGYTNQASGARTAQLYAIGGLHDSWSPFTPKIGFDYHFNPDLMSYLSVTSGQKVGGYNRAASTATIAEIPVGPEKVIAYELGTKATLWGGRATSSLALFYNDFRDYQASITNPAINGQFITGAVVVNAARARTEGAELEAAARITADWDAKLAAGYLDTRFKNFENPTGAANTDYTGNELPTAPKWTLGLSTSYRLPLLIPGAVRIDANVRYISTQFSDIANTPITQLPAQTYIGAGANYATQDNHWVFSLIVQNLADRAYPVNLKYRAGFEDEAGYSAPRQAILGARYIF